MRLRIERGRRDDLRTLHPAYFAMVMATGIVAISAHLHGLPVVAEILFWLNALFLAGLVAATVARMVRHRWAVAKDIRSHSRGVAGGVWHRARSPEGRRSAGSRLLGHRCDPLDRHDLRRAGGADGEDRQA